MMTEEEIRARLIDLSAEADALYISLSACKDPSEFDMIAPDFNDKQMRIAELKFVLGEGKT